MVWGDRYFLVFWKCTGAARGRSSADAPGHTPCGSFKWFQCATWKESRPSRCKWSQIWFTRPEAWREKHRVSRNNVVCTLLVFLYLSKRFQGLHTYHFFYRTAAPGSAVFPWFEITFWDVFYCTPKGALTALPVIRASFLEVPHTW